MAGDKPKKPGSGLPIALVVVTLIAAAGGGGLAFILPKPQPEDKAVAAKSESTEPAKGHGDSAKEAGHDKPNDGHGGAGGGKGHGGHDTVRAETTSPALPSSATKFKDLAAITTNLAGEKAPWIRLEGGLVYEAGIEADMAVLSSRITDDFVAYLRSVSVQQVSAAGGLQALVEDLNERARMRSNGKVHQFVISGFIIE